MSNDTIFTIFFTVSVGVLSCLSAVGSVKEGKKWFKKLEEHEALKRKRKEDEEKRLANG